MRASGLQRYKINEMRALKATDGPCFPAACNVCRSTSGFVCSTAAERLWRGHVPGIRLQTHPSPPAFSLGPYVVLSLLQGGGGGGGSPSWSCVSDLLPGSGFGHGHTSLVWVSSRPLLHRPRYPCGTLLAIPTPQPLQRWELC